MSIIRFIGDVHGKFSRYKTILAESPHRTHQVGDMGVGFRKWPHGEWRANPPFDMMVASGATFHRGNHDNPDTCKNHKQCIQDGTVVDNIMYIGGALSLDRANRYPDFSWWEDEELSPEELLRMTEIFAVAKPEIMVTHECPEFVAEKIVGWLQYFATKGQITKLDPRFDSRTRHAFEAMHQIHKPKLWVFGHWHVSFHGMFDGTYFVCIPELGCLDVDTEKADVVSGLIQGTDGTWGLPRGT